jgi:hypothetical protein
VLRKLDDHHIIPFTEASAFCCDLLAAHAEAQADILAEVGNPEAPKFHQLAREIKAKARAYREKPPAESRRQASTG